MKPSEKPIVAHLNLFAYGGVHPKTVSSLVKELSIGPSAGVVFSYQDISDDALISRSRSIVASRFLNDPELDVLFMLDHDIAWERGDVVAACTVAMREKAVVGGLYAVRHLHGGFSSRFARPERFIPGGEKLVEAHYVATGFMAIPRACLLQIVERLGKDGTPSDLRVTRCKWHGGMDFYDFFRCFCAPSTRPEDEGRFEYLSEDWSFSSRVRAAGMKCFVYEKPRLVHYGMYGFTQRDGLQPASELGAP